MSLMVVWAYPFGEAAAARIGMCSEDGQSIAAPPPIMPSSISVATDCQNERRENFQTQPDGSPAEHFVQPTPDGKSQCVLSVTLGRLRPRAVTMPIERALCQAAEEHRRRGFRPPIF